MPMTATQSETSHARQPEVVDVLSPAQLRAIESLRDDLNRLYDGATQRMNDIADKVFRDVFDGDIKEGLSPQKSSSARYRTLVAMCNDTLRLDRSQLSRAIRVGALNTHFSGRAAWGRLHWAVKVALLPLLGPDGDLKRLSGGITVAGKPSATYRTVRQWVADQIAAEDGSAATRNKTMSMTAANKILSGGRQLKLITARRLLANRLRRMGKAAIETAVSDIELTIKSLTQLREELVEA